MSAAACTIPSAVSEHLNFFLRTNYRTQFYDLHVEKKSASLCNEKVNYLEMTFITFFFKVCGDTLPCLLYNINVSSKFLFLLTIQEGGTEVGVWKYRRHKTLFRFYFLKNRRMIIGSTMFFLSNFVVCTKIFLYCIYIGQYHSLISSMTDENFQFTVTLYLNLIVVILVVESDVLLLKKTALQLIAASVSQTLSLKSFH